MKNKILSALILSALTMALMAGCTSGGGGSDPLSDAKAITAFALYTSPTASSPIALGTIDESAKTIAIIVPYGTDVIALVAGFITTGSSVSVGGVNQVSGTTPNDFTSPVAYVVTAGNGSTVTYTVTVTKATGFAKAITAFALATGASGTVPDAIGLINESAKTIAVSVPYGTNVTNLIATFVTTGVSVNVGATPQVSGVTPQDFTGPVVYRVTAGDATFVDYTATVTIASGSAKAITAYYLLGIPGTINESAKTIAVTVPSGTNVKGLVAVFTTSGAIVKVSSTMLVQETGTTPNDFTNPVDYIVTAADGSTATYTVTVTIAQPGGTMINLPKTGQTVTYYPGDDGALQKGEAWPNPRFTAASSGTGTVVTDNLSGLMWAGDGTMPTVGSCTGGSTSWKDALTYVGCLNSGSGYLGYTDWRMPNRKELRSLYNYGQYFMTEWLNTQGFTFVYYTFHCWSSTTSAAEANHSYAWIVDEEGIEYAQAKTDSGLVLPVRSGPTGSVPAKLPKTGQTTCYDTSTGAAISCAGTGQDGEMLAGVAWPGQRFTAGTGAEADCVIDNLTGLMWAKNANLPASTRSFTQSLDYIATTTNSGGGLCGHTDWRLPNVNELESLVHAEYTKETCGASPCATNSAWLNIQGFTNVQADYLYWSSTSIVSGGPYYRYVQIYDGRVGAGINGNAYGYVWPVRGGQ